MNTTSKLIRKLERNLAALRRIPASQRVAELADVREEICLSLLKDARGGQPMLGDYAITSPLPTLGRHDRSIADTY